MLLATIPFGDKRKVVVLLYLQRVDFGRASRVLAVALRLELSLPSRQTVSRSLCCMVDSSFSCARLHPKPSVISSRAEECNAA